MYVGLKEHSGGKKEKSGIWNLNSMQTSLTGSETVQIPHRLFWRGQLDEGGVKEEGTNSYCFVRRIGTAQFFTPVFCFEGGYWNRQFLTFNSSRP